MNSKKNKDKEKKVVRDDYYDRVNYYESRNIFSSNEPFNPSNRLYTDQAAFTHALWDKIQDTSKPLTITNDEGTKLQSKIANNLISSITKLNASSNYTPIGCKKCGYGKV